MENRTTDKVDKKAKEKEIDTRFAKKFDTNRTLASLIEKWDNMKKAVKKKLAKERQGCLGTGGGP